MPEQTTIILCNNRMMVVSSGGIPVEGQCGLRRTGTESNFSNACGKQLLNWRAIGEKNRKETGIVCGGRSEIEDT